MAANVRRIFGTAFFFAVLMALAGCGLPDSDGSVGSPGGTVAAGSVDPATRYFEVIVGNIGNSEGTVACVGVKIYYKIFGTADTMDSAVAAIRKVNTDGSQNGYSTMTSSYGFQELDTDAHNPTLITANGTYRVRLFDEGFNAASTYPAALSRRISVDDGIDWAVMGKPLRRITGEKGFSFFSSDSSYQYNNPLPVSGNADTNLGGADPSAVGTWYVYAYAVSLGQDTNFNSRYSTLRELGYIIIPKT